MLASLARLSSGTQNSVQRSYWKEPVPESWGYVSLCKEGGGREGLLERKEFPARKVLARWLQWSVAVTHPFGQPHTLNLGGWLP